MSAKATTYYSVADGNWTGAIWSLECSTCTGTAGTLPTLVAGDIIVIDDQVIIASGPQTIVPTVTIIIRTDNSPNTSTNPAKLIFTSGGKLILASANSKVVLENTTGNAANNPQIDGSGSGGSNLIEVGGVEYWRASQGDVIGVGTLQPNGTLPITLISFSATKTEKGIQLDWITAMEKSFNYFQLERAAEDLNFTTLDRIEGKGGLDINTSYLYVDASPQRGKNYYRLKSVDADESLEYSPVIVMEWNRVNQGISIYPNPTVNRSFTVELDDVMISPVSLSLFETRGYLFFETMLNSTSSTINLPDHIHEGIYFVKLSSPTGQKTVRVVVR
jgi:hypothetical protein